MPIRKQHIQQGLRDLEIGPGSEVGLIHSSLSSFGYVEGGALTVIKAFIEQVSDAGTILMPAFVQKVNGKRASYIDRERAWDRARSPSDVGLITETFRRMNGVYRSDHPTHSICAWGKGAEEATKEHKAAYGRPSPWGEGAFGIGSPWDWMYEHNTHYLLIGVGFRVCSMLHYVEALYAGLKKLYERAPPQWPKIKDWTEVGFLLKKRGSVKRVEVGSSVWHHVRAKDSVNTALKILMDSPDMISTMKLVPYGTEEWIIEEKKSEASEKDK